MLLVLQSSFIYIKMVQKDSIFTAQEERENLGDMFYEWFEK